MSRLHNLDMIAIAIKRTHIFYPAAITITNDNRWMITVGSLIHHRQVFEPDAKRAGAIGSAPSRNGGFLAGSPRRHFQSRRNGDVGRIIDGDDPSNLNLRTIES